MYARFSSGAHDTVKGIACHCNPPPLSQHVHAPALPQVIVNKRPLIDKNSCTNTIMPANFMSLFFFFFSKHDSRLATFLAFQITGFANGMKTQF